MDELKEINIENCGHYYSDDITRNTNLSLRKTISKYFQLQFSMQISHSKNILRISFNEVHRYIEKYGKDKISIIIPS